MDADLPFWMAINKVPGIGPKRFGLLIRHFGTARAVWEASAAELAAAGGSPPAERVAELEAVRSRAQRASRTVLGLLIVSVLAMATARYW